MRSEATLKAIAKYDKTHTTGIYLKLNNKTDKDILEYLSNIENKQGLIKQLIRDHITASAPDNE